MKRQIWQNGQFKPESEAKVSVYDSALMFGDMVFEMTRSFNKKHFYLRQHLDRLYDSAKYIDIKIPYSKIELTKAIDELTKYHNEVFELNDEHRLMINVSRGILPLYTNRVEDTFVGANVMITDFPLRWTVRNFSNLLRFGVNVSTVSVRTVPHYCYPAMIKNRSRLHYLLANIEANNSVNIYNHKSWALLQDENGFLAEGTGSNIFLVKDKILYTPRVVNVLNGISRQHIINYIAQRVGWRKEVVEKDLTLFDLVTADEAFFTGTPFCLVPIVSVNGNLIGNGTPGRITSDIFKEWSYQVGVDIIEQIEEWDNEETMKTRGQI